MSEEKVVNDRLFEWLVELFLIVGHERKEAEEMGRVFEGKIFETAAVEYQKRGGEEEMEQAIAGLKKASSRDEAIAGLQNLTADAKFWDALSDAIEGIVGFYTAEIASSLSNDQKEKYTECVKKLEKLYE